jgi:hypothetical protein
VTKFLLDRGVTMHCKLVSRHYRRSPLVQGGLEIKCEVVFTSRATILQSKLATRYLDLVKNLYLEPVQDTVVGDIFNFVMTLPPAVNILATKNNKRKKVADPKKNRDIREMFSAGKKKKASQVIVIDE